MKIKDLVKSIKAKTQAELGQSARELHDTIAKSKIEAALGDPTKVKSMRPQRKQLARTLTALTQAKSAKTVQVSAKVEEGNVKLKKENK